MSVSSFGVLLHEIVSGERPHSRVEPSALRCDGSCSLASHANCLAHPMRYLCGPNVILIYQQTARSLWHTIQCCSFCTRISQATTKSPHCFLMLDHGPVRRVPEDCPQTVADLWQACIQEEPSARPTAAEVHAGLAGILGLGLPTNPLSGSGTLRPSAHDTAYAPHARVVADELLDTVRACSD